MVSHHAQQASKCNGEQQHRELWPAYNPNVVPPQASTEGLFQQTRLVSTVITSGLPVTGEGDSQLGGVLTPETNLAKVLLFRISRIIEQDRELNTAVSELGEVCC